MQVKLHKNICFIGLPACGKTRIANLLADAYGFPHVDLDRQLEHITGQTISDYWNSWGESGFRSMERSILLNQLSRSPQIIGIGGGTPEYFDNMAYMLTYGCVIYLKADPEFLLHRIVDDSRPLFRNAPDKLEILKSLYKRRSHFYNRAHLSLDASKNEHYMIENVKTYCTAHGIIIN